MNNLLIVGNGFDLAHGIASKYSDFYNYWGEHSYGDNDTTFEALKLSQTDRLWGSFEEDLSKVRITETQVPERPYASDPDEFENDLAGYSNLAHNFAWEIISELNDQFHDWVSSIDISKSVPLPILRKLIDSASWILSFNYTDTLEAIYGIDPNKVVHLHGRASTRSRLIFGCAETSDPGWDYTDDAAVGMARDDARVELLESLTKELQLETLQARRLPLEEINSIGFSFSPVDIPYVQEMSSWCNSRTIWANYSHSISDDIQFREALEECDFSGRVQTRQI